MVKDMSANEKLINVLKKHTASDFYVGSNIPKNKLNNAIAAFPISNDVQVLALIDCTVFGSCDEGIAITDCGLVWKNDWYDTSKSNLTWYELLNSKIRVDGNNILFGHGIGFSMAGSGMNSKVVFNLLDAIVDLILSIIQDFIINANTEGAMEFIVKEKFTLADANSLASSGTIENLAIGLFYQGILEQIKTENKKSKKQKIRQDIGISAGAIGSAQNYADNVILSAERGHGFAAEKANHLHDVFTGKDAKLVGGNNAKNGADRLVDGVSIQTKYCNSGSKSIAETFENGKFKYWNADGSPMQIEVASDMYDSAVQAMEDRIRKGQVSGVTDPAKAKEIVRKGSYTYAQVRNIARFGTIESITYDAVNGIKISGTAMGISSAISFAVAMWNGEKWDIALENACYDGLKVGGIVWVSSLLTAQLGRTGIEQGLRGSTDWVVQQMGPKAATWLANGLRSGSNIYGAAAMNNVSKLLRGNIVTGVVTTLVLSSVDFVRMFDGKVSGAQVFKNVTTTAASVAGGAGGWWGGAATGAAIGSAIPIIGTAAGGIIGGILGSFAGGTVASAVAFGVLDTFIEDDAKEMLGKIELVFGQLAEDYLLVEKEAKLVIEEFQNRDIPDTLRDMYASNDRHAFAKNILEPLIEQQARNRKKINLPSDKEIIKKTGIIIEQLA